MANYTKGEWKIAEEDSRFVYCLNREGTNRFSLLVQGNYAGNDTISVEELEANARLIAAAPDMYEALTMVAHQLDGGSINVKQIYEALAKAEGK